MGKLARWQGGEKGVGFQVSGEFRVSGVGRARDNAKVQRCKSAKEETEMQRHARSAGPTQGSGWRGARALPEAGRIGSR